MAWHNVWKASKEFNYVYIFLLFQGRVQFNSIICSSNKVGIKSIILHLTETKKTSDKQRIELNHLSAIMSPINSIKCTIYLRKPVIRVNIAKFNEKVIDIYIFSNIKASNSVELKGGLRKMKKPIHDELLRMNQY